MVFKRQGTCSSRQTDECYWCLIPFTSTKDGQLVAIGAACNDYNLEVITSKHPIYRP